MAPSDVIDDNPNEEFSVPSLTDDFERFSNHGSWKDATASFEMGQCDKGHVEKDEVETNWNAPLIEKEKRLKMMVEELKRDIAERKVENSLKLDDLKLRNIELKSRARRLESNVLHMELFEEYDLELNSLCKRQEQRRSQLVKVLKDLLQVCQEIRPSTTSNVRVVEHDLVILEKRASKLRQEKAQLERERRQSAVRNIRVDGKSILLRSATMEYRSLQNRLEQTKLKSAELEARAHMAQRKVNELEETVSHLKQDQIVCRDYIDDLRVMSGAVKEELDRDAVLDRFVSKHASMKNPHYIPQRATADFETARASLKIVSEELAILDSKLQERATNQENSPYLLLAKIRVELDKLQSKMFQALIKEENVSHALVNFVQTHSTADI